MNIYTPSRAQQSRAAIQRLQTAMRHLFIRGGYKPLGVSGESMIDALLTLKPEIYGSIADEEKVELGGMLYIFQRLPIGIEQSRYIKLIAREGFEKSTFEAIIPSKRRRNCYRIDQEQMYIEMTRGRSDIYDVLTHLTFMYIEAEKIRKNALDAKDRETRAWEMLREIVLAIRSDEVFDKEVGYTYLSTLLGRTYNETMKWCEKFDAAEGVNTLFEIAYWLGLRSMEEYFEDVDREIVFSSNLREQVGHHINGEYWANQIKQQLTEKGLFDREIHIISANLHSVMNTLYGRAALKKEQFDSLEDLAEHLSVTTNKAKRSIISEYALKHGMSVIHDPNRTNISVQIFDLDEVELGHLSTEIKAKQLAHKVLVVMDYAFGEQAYETIDELLKPYETCGEKCHMDIRSINIMGKAGILCGKKGDIMLPTAHVFEGSADNYIVDNALTMGDLTDTELSTYEGTMITVLGTSLQNKDILRYFHKSSWKAIGLEMEGAHYLKAIQAASKIRDNVRKDIVIRNAYYASDNPLETGSTLASGSLGLDGVKPTYLITTAILNGIFKA